MRSQFEGLADIRAAQVRKVEDQKEIQRYERALSTNQGRIKTVRRMVLNHPSWLNKCLVIQISSGMSPISPNSFTYSRDKPKMQFHNGHWNALHLAASEGQLRKVLWLLQQKDIDVNTPDTVRQVKWSWLHVTMRLDIIFSIQSICIL